jgi:hypothetical protein
MDWLLHAAKNRVRVRANIYIPEGAINKFRGFVKAHTIGIVVLRWKGAGLKD